MTADVHAGGPNGAIDGLRTGLADGVMTLTLHRPARRNAIDMTLARALADALERAEKDPAVRVVVIEGADGRFSAGGDVQDMTGDGIGGGLALADLIAFQRNNQRATSLRLFEMAKPTLAVIDGYAAGAGLALALACDMRIMARDAFMTTAFTSVGLSGDYGAAWFLTRLAGPARARELMFLSERISAEEALRIGLVNRVCEPGALREAGRALARRLAERPPLALAYAKEACNRAVGPAALADCLDMEASLNLQLTLTDDHRRAVDAFVTKAEAPGGR